MKALVGAFNKEKALVGAFSVIVQPVVEPMEHYTALICNMSSQMSHVISLWHSTLALLGYLWPQMTTLDPSSRKSDYSFWNILSLFTFLQCASECVMYLSVLWSLFVDVVSIKRGRLVQVQMIQKSTEQDQQFHLANMQQTINNRIWDLIWV